MEERTKKRVLDWLRDTLCVNCSRIRIARIWTVFGLLDNLDKHNNNNKKIETKDF